MNTLAIIDTGGTFNKIYNKINGELEVDTTNKALTEMFKKWMCNFEIINIIGKDSLDFTDEDRKLLEDTINFSDVYKNYIVIHGTDTMDISAAFIDKPDFDKNVVFTGAMIPYSIDPAEATANFSMAAGFLRGITDNGGIFISMNGIVEDYKKVKKERGAGRFIIN